MRWTGHGGHVSPAVKHSEAPAGKDLERSGTHSCFPCAKMKDLLSPLEYANPRYRMNVSCTTRRKVKRGSRVSDYPCYRKPFKQIEQGILVDIPHAFSSGGSKTLQVWTSSPGPVGGVGLFCTKCFPGEYNSK